MTKGWKERAWFRERERKMEWESLLVGNKNLRDIDTDTHKYLERYADIHTCTEAGKH